MPIIIQIAFVLGTLMSSGVGGLMLFAPRRYPAIYEHFLSASVMRRQRTEHDRILTIRVQGLIALAVGGFFALFVWALR
jgi:hypothetical protein